MKMCPICGARAFDDADTCYGCLHRFDNEDAVVDETPDAVGAVRGEEVEERLMPGESSAGFAQHTRQLEALGTLPAFRLRFMPVADEVGGLVWSCSVETC